MSQTTMSCGDALAVLLAQDEVPASDRVRARAHASRCPRCSDAYSMSLSLRNHRQIPVFEPRAWPWWRALLVLAAGVQLVIAVPWLVGHSLIPDSHIAVSHLTRDGALGLIGATVGLGTAWRLRYVYSTMLLSLVLLGLQLLADMFDHSSYSVNPSFELVHLPLLLIALTLFAVGANMSRRATPFSVPHPPALRIRDHHSASR